MTELALPPIFEILLVKDDLFQKSLVLLSKLLLLSDVA
jgi:hypothetical protein